MTILRKDSDPGGASGYIPGTPPVAPRPAYCLDVSTTVPGYSVVYISDPGDPTTGRPPGVITVVVSTGAVTVVEHQCFPASGGSPGTPAIYVPAVAANYHQGWNASADSIPVLDGDGEYQFSADPSAVGIVTGLTSDPSGSGYLNITHGVYFASGQWQYMEGGVAITPPESFVSTDVFALRRLGTQIALFKNNTLEYTSTTPSDGAVYADASLYFGGDEILSAAIVTTVPVAHGISGGSGVYDPAPPSGGSAVPAPAPGTIPRYNSVNGKLGQLVGFSSDSSSDAQVGSGGSGGSGPGDGSGDGTGSGGGSGGGNSTGDGDYTGRTGGELRGLVGTAISYDVVTCAGLLTGLTGQAFGSSDPLGDPDPGTHYAIATPTLTGLTGYAEGGFIQPQYAICSGSLTPLAGFSWGVTGNAGNIQGKLGQLVGFSSDNASDAQVGSGGDGGSGPGNGSGDGTGSGGGSGGGNSTGDGDYSGRTGGELRGLVGLAYDSTALSPGYMFAELPAISGMLGFGYSPEILDSGGNPLPGYGMYGTLPALTFEGGGGATMEATLPALTFVGVGRSTVLGGVAEFLPALTFEGAGVVTVIGKLDAKLPALKMDAGYGAGEMVAKLPRLAFTGAGKVGRVGGVIADLPALTFSGSGVVPLCGVMVGELPALRIIAPGVMLATLPALTMVGIGGSPVTVEYEAYSLALVPGDNGETVYASHYTNYPFDRILRFGDTYYGVAPDGLYALDGTDFNGTPIVSVVTSPPHDYPGENRPGAQIKGGRALYLAGAIGADLEVSVTINQGTLAKTYVYKPASQRSGAHTHRVDLGRGLQARYWSFSFTNPKGEDFTLEEATPEFDVLKRTVWD